MDSYFDLSFPYDYTSSNRDTTCNAPTQHATSAQCQYFRKTPGLSQAPVRAPPPDTGDKSNEHTPLA
jgi:hypothetical protein